MTGGVEWFVLPGTGGAGRSSGTQFGSLDLAIKGAKALSRQRPEVRLWTVYKVRNERWQKVGALRPVSLSRVIARVGRAR